MVCIVGIGANLCVVYGQKPTTCGVFESGVLVCEVVKNFPAFGHIFVSKFLCRMMVLLGFSR